MVTISNVCGFDEKQTKKAIPMLRKLPASYGKFKIGRKGHPSRFEVAPQPRGPVESDPRIPSVLTKPTVKTPPPSSHPRPQEPDIEKPTTSSPLPDPDQQTPFTEAADILEEAATKLEILMSRVDLTENMNSVGTTLTVQLQRIKKNAFELRTGLNRGLLRSRGVILK